MRLRRSMRLASAVTFGACVMDVARSQPTSLPAARAIDHVVNLVVTAPAGADVDAIYLAGSAPGVGRWRADGVRLERRPDGTYAGDVALPPGTRLEFKFTRRGTWASVEKRPDGVERDNRVLAVEPDVGRVHVSIERWADDGVDAPHATSATTGASATQPAIPHTVVGTLRLHELDAPALGGGRRTIRVWLPAGYDAATSARYDVLYLHDGQNCFDRATSAFGHEWEIDETLTRLIADGKVPPLIVCAIDNGGLRRVDELTFDSDPKYGGGHGKLYESFLLDTVVGFIDATYRTNSGGEHRLIGGASLGGVASLEIARRHPGAFAGAIVMSPSLWWADGRLTDAIAQDAGGLSRMRVWLDIGTQETGEGPAADAKTVEATRALDAILSRHGVSHRFDVADGGHHNEAAWATRFPTAIAFVLGH